MKWRYSWERSLGGKENHKYKTHHLTRPYQNNMATTWNVIVKHRKVNRLIYYGNTTEIVLNCLIYYENVYRKSTELPDILGKHLQKENWIAWYIMKMSTERVLNCLIYYENIYRNSTKLPDILWKCLQKEYWIAWYTMKTSTEREMNCLIYYENVYRKSTEFKHKHENHMNLKIRFTVASWKFQAHGMCTLCNKNQVLKIY
jgi:hypothetical protein